MTKNLAIILGIIFIIVGIWGFWPPAVGFIAADSVSSIIHIIVGIVLLALASKPKAAMVLKSFGIIYIIFAMLGFIQGDSVLGGTFVTNMTTNWIYLILGIIMAAVGWSGKKGMGMSSGMSSGISSPSAPPMSSPPPQM